MKIQDIKSKIWEMANKLRGTMDASEYKNYILPFMFYRYLSQNQDVYIINNDLQDFYELTEPVEIDEYITDIVANLGYAINPEYRWESITEKISTHQIKASDFQDLFESFENNAKRNPISSDDFANVFADVNLGDSRLGNNTNERAKALFDIILLINDFDFKDENGKDLLGEVYEFLIGQFAASAGKKGGEFYTPHEVSKILARIVTLNTNLGAREQFSVYDPTMGSGSLLLTVQNELPNNEEDGAVVFYGQELNTTTYNLARMNLMMHGVNYRNMKLLRGNTLGEDWPENEKNGIATPKTFDAVVANPPYSQKWAADRDKDPRFKAGLAPKSKADFAFIQHGIYHLKDTGTMAIVLPHGVLFRGASEGKIRETLIRENRLDAVIGLPSNLFYGTSIPTVILVFKGSKLRDENNVLFIDASNDFEKKKNQNVLSDENINKIMDAYINRENVDKYAYLATFDEIEENEFNLNIPRYVDTFEEEEVVPLSEIADKLVEVNKQIKETTKELFAMMDELVGTTPEDEDELRYFINKLKEVSNNE